MNEEMIKAARDRLTAMQNAIAEAKAAYRERVPPSELPIPLPEITLNTQAKEILVEFLSKLSKNTAEFNHHATLTQERMNIYRTEKRVIRSTNYTVEPLSTLPEPTPLPVDPIITKRQSLVASIIAKMPIRGEVRHRSDGSRFFVPPNLPHADTASPSLPIPHRTITKT
jgi:hypothetical protein